MIYHHVKLRSILYVELHESEYVCFFQIEFTAENFPRSFVQGPETRSSIDCYDCI